MTRSDDPEARRTTVATGLAFSLSAACFEMTVVTVLFAPSRLPPPAGVWASLAATVVVFLVVFFVPWFLVLAPLGRRLRLDPGALTCGWTVFLATTSSFLALRPFPVSAAPLDLFRLAVVSAIALLASAGSYSLARSGAAKSGATLPGGAGSWRLAVPLVLAEAMGLAWFCRHRVESFFAPPSLVAAAAFVVLAAATAAVVSRGARKTREVRWLTALTALAVGGSLVAVALAGPSEVTAPPAPAGNLPIPRVILITDDTLRSDHLSCYGAPAGSTPHLDRLAADGILFRRARSPAPWTLPSLASILTGLAPPVHRATRLPSRLADGAQTLAERLRDSGYATAAFVQTRMVAPELNLFQGFLEVHLPDRRVYPTWGGRLLERLLPDRLRPQESARSLTRAVVAWLETHGGEDFFLWVHYVDPHMPYTPPADLLRDPDVRVDGRFLAAGLMRSGYVVPTAAEREAIRELYAAEVRLVDGEVGKLLRTLDRLGLYDGSLIVFAGDHGEELWEHGGFEHGHSLHDELLRVPLIVKPPASAGRRIETPVSTQSVLPTVLDLCGIGYDAGSLSGESLRPLWERPDGDAGAGPVFSTAVLFFEDRESVVVDGFKYVRSLVGDREELYDLENDPREQVSVISRFPERVRRAREALEENRRRNLEVAERHRLSGEEARLDEETRKNLEALGYLK